MAKVTDKAEEIKSVTLTLTKEEAEAIRALTGRCSPKAVGSLYNATHSVYTALGAVGILTPVKAANRFRITGIPTDPFGTRDDSGENCVYGQRGCDCKTRQSKSF